MSNLNERAEQLAPVIERFLENHKFKHFQNVYCTSAGDIANAIELALAEREQADSANLARGLAIEQAHDAADLEIAKYESRVFNGSVLDWDELAAKVDDAIHSLSTDVQKSSIANDNLVMAAQVGDEVNQCLQIIITNAGNWYSAHSQREVAYDKITKAISRAAKAIRELTLDPDVAQALAAHNRKIIAESNIVKTAQRIIKIESLATDSANLARGLALEQAAQHVCEMDNEFAILECSCGWVAERYDAELWKAHLRSLDPDAAQALAAHDAEQHEKILREEFEPWREKIERRARLDGRIEQHEKECHLCQIHLRYSKSAGIERMEDCHPRRDLERERAALSESQPAPAGEPQPQAPKVICDIEKKPHERDAVTPCRNPRPAPEGPEERK